jgi:hypothetical protein
VRLRLRVEPTRVKHLFLFHSRGRHSLTFKLSTRMEIPARDKYSTLLRTLVHYGRKKLYNIDFRPSFRNVWTLISWMKSSLIKVRKRGVFVNPRPNYCRVYVYSQKFRNIAFRKWAFSKLKKIITCVIMILYHRVTAKTIRA